MGYYEKELRALHRSGRYRQRRQFDPALTDLASNDYLGLAENADCFEKAVAMVRSAPSYGAKASMLVNGYHPIHEAFEAALCAANGFESGIVVGSGFSANIAMIEALVRRGDALFIDASYHASGILATKLSEGTITSFAHNDVAALEALLEASDAARKIVAVEGIYSMEGDLCDRRIFELCDRYDAILIVDEAHSSGVVGPNLMGVFDRYGIATRPNHIKMGTLGKAYGGFGAYILASEHIVNYLVNRAKPVIYATAPSLFETAHAHAALEHIVSHTSQLKHQILERQQAAAAILGCEPAGLIVPVEIGDNNAVMEIQARLMDAGMLVGAIRQPTVPRAIIRLIARTSVPLEAIERACRLVMDAKQ